MAKNKKDKVVVTPNASEVEKETVEIANANPDPEIEEIPEPSSAVKRMVELRKEVENKTVEFNALNLANKSDDAKKLGEEIEEDIAEYTILASKQCYKKLSQEKDPMIAAIKQLTFPTIKKKDTKIGEEKIPVRTIEDTEKEIDLLKLHMTVPGGIGKSNDWNGYVERFNYLVAVRQAKGIGLSAEKMTKLNDSYALGTIAQKLAKGETPTSNTQMLKGLSEVVEKMIGKEYKVTSHDVEFLKQSYSRKAKDPKMLIYPKHSLIRSILMSICNKIVTNGEYTVIFPEKK